MSQATSDSSPALAAAPLARANVRNWLIVWSVVAVVLITLLSFQGALDQFTWCATRWAVGDRSYYTWTQYQADHAADTDKPFYAVVDPPLDSQFFKRTAFLWRALKIPGEPWLILALTVVVGIVERRHHWLSAGGFVVAVSLAGGLAALIRIIDGRYRPTHIDGASRWELFRGFHDGTDLSFPSGHATAAFAAAAVLAYLWPKGRYFFAAVAAGTALSRVVVGAHFYSDVIFGAAFGWTVGWFTIRFLHRIVVLRSRTTDSQSAPPHP